jgi:hypothetical protein
MIRKNTRALQNTQFKHFTLIMFHFRLLARSGSRQQTVSVTSMTNTYRCIYSIKTPDDEQQICSKHVKLFTKMKLRNSASRWLLL